MSLPSIFDRCVPREDVRSGGITESDFAADRAQVHRGEAPSVYRDARELLANTRPTRGLKDLLRNVCLRLRGSSDQAASIFRLDTNYGGGKTHALIALAHIARGTGEVVNAGEFVDPSLLPAGPVRIAAFDGENADPSNGRPLGEGVWAYTPWGELALALGGRAGYEQVRRSDEEGGAPGADTLRELFGGEPTLILLDELAVYLRKLKVREPQRAGGQLTAFLTGLFKAVESSPRAALVYTLAIEFAFHGKAADAQPVKDFLDPQLRARQHGPDSIARGARGTVLRAQRSVSSRRSDTMEWDAVTRATWRRKAANGRCDRQAAERRYSTLRPAEELQLVEDLWDDLAATPEGVPGHPGQNDERARREANLRRVPASGLAWEEVQRRLRAHRAARKPAS